jgi:hypothetical protein
MWKEALYYCVGLGQKWASILVCTFGPIGRTLSLDSLLIIVVPTFEIAKKFTRRRITANILCFAAVNRRSRGAVFKITVEWGIKVAILIDS